MTVTIDGAYGEGGGQIIRTSLALSVITGQACRIENIRANRKNPGLQNQHLMAVRAAAAIGQARVSGDELGSRKVTFEPSGRQPGDYNFNIGTAGSTSLVLQSILPPLMTADHPSTVVLEGGTHNPMAPPYDFLEHTFLPIIRRLGVRVDVQIDRYGFYPKGGGLVCIKIEPAKLARIDIPARSMVKNVSAQILLVNLPRHIAEREQRVLQQSVPQLSEVQIVEKTNSPGAGNMVAVHVESDVLTETITSLGERGLSAEKVAESAAASLRSYLKFDAAVGDHLADQLLLPMVLAGGGSFITGPLTEHTRTNVHVIKQFLDVLIRVEETADSLVKINIG